LILIVYEKMFLPVRLLSTRKMETICRISYQYNIMQLPRGTFLSIKRSTKAGDLLMGLQEMKFTGVCTLSFGSINGTIVFKYGKRILAQYRDITGDAAWDELQKIAGEKVDASLSALNEAQIQLSLEFNKQCLIVKGGKPEKPATRDVQAPPQTILPSSIISPKPVQPVPVKSHQKPGIPKITPANTPAKVATVHAPEPPKIISDSQLRSATQIAGVQLKTQIYTQKPDEKKTADPSSHQEETDSSSFEMDIETFETMDVEAIRNKIRGECTSLIKELNLEHLAENEKGRVRR
jgi:hypothetical protein